MVLYLLLFSLIFTRVLYAKYCIELLKETDGGDVVHVWLMFVKC